MLDGPQRRAAAQRLAPLLGAIGSLAIHAVVYSVASWASTLPSLGLELELPAEVEFGVTEASLSPPPRAPEPPQAAPTPPSPPAPPTPEADPAPGDLADAGSRRDAGVDAGLDAGVDAGLDAGPADASTRDAAPALPDAEADAAPLLAADAGGDGATPTVDAGPPLLSAYAPPGAQLSLRLDMGRVRSSPLAREVQALLEAVPDWKLVLEGSGIDPLTDLERLYLASPNLQRSRLVIAGQHTGGEDLPQRAVANLAKARGVRAVWRREGELWVAPWANADATPRVVALIAPGQFTITRREDLPRVLAVAEELAARRAPDGGLPPADALLALGPEETLAVSVEGVHQYVRGMTRGIPGRLEAAARQTEDGPIQVYAVGHFEDEDEAAVALTFWRRQLAVYARHPLIAFTGMGGPLKRAKLTHQELTVRLDTEVTRKEAKVLLGVARDAVAPPPPPPGFGPPKRRPGAPQPAP